MILAVRNQETGQWEELMVIKGDQGPAGPVIEWK
jgi:hypothetical protein